ncbi:methyltransferase type 11 [Actinokineospora sp. NBRC 105648]|nr:methyltransferase type 11 [Actinokineospora sp. NBRC 105648]
MAESFGSNPERYDRTRPSYPDELVVAVVARGRDILDVGCGTGIAARQFQAASAQVLGVDVDPRMAEFARRTGVEVEVSAFEAWDPAGRTFDVVTAGQTWHWVGPVAGAAQAARVLRPGGLLALFWNVFQPAPEVGEAFAEVHRRVAPDSPLNPWTVSDGYSRLLTAATDGISQAGAFSSPEQWQFDWERTYTRDEWLDQMATSGGAGELPLADLQAATGSVIDGFGGSFTMGYRTQAITATRD